MGRRWRHNKKSWVVAATLLILFCAWPTTPALAHASLIRSDPPDLCNEWQNSATDGNCASGSILTTSPTAVHLWFSEPVQTVRHGLIIISPSGQQVEQGNIQTENSEISIKLNAAETGTYQVIWQVISSDSHPVIGRFNFSVGHSSPVAQLENNAPTGNASSLGLFLQTLARWLHFLGYALAFGPALFNLAVLSSFRQESEIVQGKLAKLVNWGIACLLLAEPLALLAQNSSLSVSQTFDLDLSGDVLSSSFGRVLGQQIGAAILLWVVLGLTRQKPLITNFIVIGVGVILALVDGQASHAVSSGPLLLGLIANTVHILAMGAWIGGLITLWLVWNTSSLSDKQAIILRRFGRLASVALLWLIASGLVMAYLHLAQFSDLWNSDYGKTLALKLLVLLVVLLFVSFSIFLRKKHSQRGWLLEIAALLVAVMLAGLLVSLPPPA